MELFTLAEFQQKYKEYSKLNIPSYKVDEASEMIFSQIGLRYRDTSWTSSSVPLPIKEACMEQLRFMLEHDIPTIDFNKKIKAGSMEANLISDISTLSLRILGNSGYLYRGNALNQNMGLNMPFGG
jgi:hypothetical protein